jgi:hypothetical protein
MKNAIIINGTVYELVPATSDDPCEDCDLHDECFENFNVSLCVYLHDAELDDNYIKRQKGGQP